MCLYVCCIQINIFELNQNEFWIELNYSYCDLLSNSDVI